MTVKSIYRNRKEKSVSCAPFFGAELKCLAPGLRPPEANVYQQVCENATRLRPLALKRAQSGWFEFNDCDSLLAAPLENFEWKTRRLKY